MSRLIAPLFTSEFSKTYADLLKNVAPLEHRSGSDATESDYTLYPVLGESGRKFPEGIRIESKASPGAPAPLKVRLKATNDQLEEPTNDPELRFLLEVLEKTRTHHKDVVSDEAVRKNHRNYRRYLGDQGPQ